MIQVTKSFLPPLDSYIEYLKGIWERGQLTNHGPLVLELEKVLADYLQVKHVFFVANGTMALQIAAKALGIQRKIITTPFSCVATTSAMVWEGIEPVPTVPALPAVVEHEGVCAWRWRWRWRWEWKREWWG
jgi:dTDP-4-amino-4,6-dideoxygalactose transaminase